MSSSTPVICRTACILANRIKQTSYDMNIPENFSTAIGIDRKKGPITSLHVFDFDGTLVRTPGPVEGKEKFVQRTGEKWKGGWWGNPKSLSPPVFDFPVSESLLVKTVFNELEEVVTRSETAVGVVVTGRIRKVRSAVLRILDDICISAKNDTVPEGESFLNHEAIFTHPGGSDTTLEYKQKLFRNLITQKPLVDSPLRELHIWEDREPHAKVFASEFSEHLQSETNITTIVHFVSPQMP